jgi:hypothetical protein
LAGAASMTCDRPAALLLYGSTACNEFFTTSLELEHLAADLIRSHAHAKMLSEGLVRLATGIQQWFEVVLIDDLEPCAGEAALMVVERLDSTADRIALDVSTSSTLLDRIATVVE